MFSPFPLNWSNLQDKHIMRTKFLETPGQKNKWLGTVGPREQEYEKQFPYDSTVEAVLDR